MVSDRQGEDVPGGMTSQSSYISLSFPPSLSQVNSSYLSLVVGYIGQDPHHVTRTVSVCVMKVALISDRYYHYGKRDWLPEG